MRFYGPGDVLLGEVGPNQGVFMPAGSRYWFEKAGTEDLEVLQQVFKSGKSERVNIDAHKTWMEDDMLKIYEAPPAGKAR